MKFVEVTVLAGLLLMPSARAQKLELRFDALAAKASEKAEMDLDGGLLKLFLQHAGPRSGDVLSEVREVHVRHYEFNQAGAWTEQDLEPLRKQVGGSAGWSRLMKVQEKAESAEVFVLSQGGKITGCLIIATEARELSVVYLQGTLTLAQVKELADSDAMGHLAALVH